MIAFLLLTFRLFSFWVGLEALLIMLGGYALSWLFALGLLSVLGRRGKFPWLIWMSFCAVRGASPAIALVLPDWIDKWFGPEPVPSAPSPPGVIICVGARGLDPFYFWGGSIWAMLGGLAYGSTWEHGLWGSRLQQR